MSFKLTQKGSASSTVVLLLTALVIIFALVRISQSHVSADSSKISSGIKDYCLDDHQDSTVSDSVVDNWQCNNSAAQVWSANYETIIHNTDCLTVKGDSTQQNSPIVLSKCISSPGQVWLRDLTGYFNPNSGLCLSTSQNLTDNQLVAANCDLTKASQTWTPSSSNLSCVGSRGDKVSCNAIKEWSSWQAGSNNHTNLLNSYTDGAPYEEWCADFVSYIYKEAGYPFTGGEADGWDENIAGNIQNQGFTDHPVASGYLPKAGDVAFFDYPGGHVEIVVSGGKNPTFVYGDSATIDPTTGNGQMEANTITNVSGLGQVTDYLSPN